MKKQKILITGNFDLSDAWSQVSDRFEIIHRREFSRVETLFSDLSESWAYILGGPEYADESLLKQAPILRHLVVMGTGTSSFVDERAACAQGVQVHNTPHLNADAVAEFALGTMILSLARYCESVDGVHRGDAWLQTPRLSLRDAQIGIIGMGAIGTCLTKKLRSLGAENISYYSPHRRPEQERTLGIAYRSLPELLATSDVASLHLRSTEENRGLIGRQVEVINPKLALLNFSNPRLIDSRWLRNALLNGQIRFCSVDGYYREWVENQGTSIDAEQLLELGPNLFVASSHIAAQEQSCIRDIQLRALGILESQR